MMPENISMRKKITLLKVLVDTFLKVCIQLDDIKDGNISIFLPLPPLDFQVENGGHPHYSESLGGHQPALSPEGSVLLFHRLKGHPVFSRWTE